jgi:hypothetical protein
MFMLLFRTTQSFVLDALQVLANDRVTIQPSPLIGGPAWLPVHCKVILNDTHAFDFVPLNAASTKTLRRLITFQSVPATVRIIHKNDETVVQGSCDDGIDDGDGERVTNLYVERAVQFSKEYDQDLHLVSNNCWSFAFDLLRNISRPESTRGE